MNTEKITFSNLSKKTSIVKEGLFFSTEPSVNDHFHDFYEFTLVLDKKIIARVNGDLMEFSKGDLMVFRPYDIHYKSSSIHNMANFGLSHNSMNSLLDYLGDHIDKGKFTRISEFPVVSIPHDMVDDLAVRIYRISQRFHEGNSLAPYEFRAIIVELLVYFVPLLLVKEDNLAPFWLDNTIKQMEKVDCLAEGLPALLRIAQKTPSYLCRIFKKYYNLTPTQYINRMRIIYSASLLSGTDLDVMDIAANAGFESLSHFYHCFKMYYKIPPQNYRKLRHAQIGSASEGIS